MANQKLCILRGSTTAVKKSLGFTQYLSIKSPLSVVCSWLQQALPKAVTLLDCLLGAVRVLRKDHRLRKEFKFLSDFHKN